MSEDLSRTLNQEAIEKAISDILSGCPSAESVRIYRSILPANEKPSQTLIGATAQKILRDKVGLTVTETTCTITMTPHSFNECIKAALNEPREILGDESVCKAEFEKYAGITWGNEYTLSPTLGAQWLAFRFAYYLNKPEREASEIRGDNVDYKERCYDLEWANRCLTKQLQEHIDLLAQTKPMRETVTLSETEVESAMGDFIEEWSASSIYEAVPRFMKIYKLSKIEVGGTDADK